MRQLRKKETKWMWTGNEEKTLAKKRKTKTKCLALFTINQDNILELNASRNRLGIKPG